MTFKKGRTLFDNMGLISWRKFMLIIQILIWGNSMLVFYTSLFLAYPLTNFTSLMLNFLCVVTRCSSIAAKYATFPKKLIQKYKEVQVPIEEMQSEHLLGEWAVQDPKIIEKEAINAILRNNFDSGVFYITFLDTLSESIEKDMLEVETKLKLPPSSAHVEFCYGGKRKYYTGLMIFYALVRKFNSAYSSKWTKKWILVQAFICCLMPLIARLILGLPVYSTSSGLDTFTFYFNILSSFQLLFFTNKFFIQARKDIDRNVYIMKQLSHLISSQKKSDEIAKVLPTLNFLEESSLNSWKILRRLSMDYGKRYFYRHEIYLPVSFCLAFICFFGIFLLQSVQNRFPSLFSYNFNLLEFQILLCEFSFCLFHITFDLLWGFAKINEFYEVHTLKLATVRQVLCDLLKYDLYYFGKYFQDMEQASFGKCNFFKEVFRTPSESHVHTRLAREIATVLGPLIDTKLTKYLEKSIETIDRITADLATDQKYQSIVIMGFVITKPFTAQLFVIIVSITVGFYQLFIV